ncbi:MAG: hypothetical protein ACLT3J_17335, partial [Ruminococcus sp.]
DKFDLVRGQVILAVKLLVDFRHRLAPINVGMVSKVLKGNVFPFVWCNILCSLHRLTRAHSPLSCAMDK